MDRIYDLTGADPAQRKALEYTGTSVDTTFGQRGSRHSKQMRPVRRIVTGQDARNRSVVISDGMPELVQTLAKNGPAIYEIWHTQGSHADTEQCVGGPQAETSLDAFGPGTRIQVLDLLPEGREMRSAVAEAAPPPGVDGGTAHGVAQAGAQSQHPLTRSKSVDYCIVLQGEITLILEETETLISAGDIVIQRGTAHAWANRSGRLCRMAFVRVGGELDATSRAP